MNPPAAHPREDDAAAYVFGAMEPADRVAFVHAMKQDASLAALVDELQQTAAAFALTVPQVAPPAAVREQVLERIKPIPQDKVHRPAPPPRSWIARNAPAVLGWAAGLALLGTSVMLWVDDAKQKRELAEANAQRAKALEVGQRAERVAADAVAQAKALASQLSEAEKNADTLKTKLTEFTQAHTVVKQQLADSNKTVEALRQDVAQRDQSIGELKMELAALTSANDTAKVQIASLQSSLKEYKEGVAVVVWNSEKKEGILKLEKMPPIKTGKDYNLWVIDSSQPTPINAGVVRVNDKGFAKVDFKPAMDIQRADKFALSVEKQGGAPAGEGPSGPVVLVGK